MGLPVFLNCEASSTTACRMATDLGIDTDAEREFDVGPDATIVGSEAQLTRRDSGGAA